MKIKIVSAILLISWTCLFSTMCRNKEAVERLKSKLNSAINESNPFETAELLDRLERAGVDPKTLPITAAADVIIDKAPLAYAWETVTGDELVRLYGPLEDLLNGTWKEHRIRAAYFWGLMETGKRKKALEMWRKSEERIRTILESPISFLLALNDATLPEEERKSRGAQLRGVIYFVIGFVSSQETEDRHQGIDLARKHHDLMVAWLKEEVRGIRLANPAAQAQIMRLIYDEPLLAYSLVESGLATDTTANPFLKDQPETNIRFQLVRRTGFEECGLRTALGDYNRIALGDYDRDGYVDVLIPDHGLWRNLGGSGKFKRVDKELCVNIKGTCGAFADVNNDSLVDVIVASPDKFGVSLQTKKRFFRPVIAASDTVAENPAAIGLFDGDGDGLIDVYLASSEKLGSGRTVVPDTGMGVSTLDVVLRNKGDGTFENVADAWEFSGDDIMQYGQGVSPGDYDNDGRTDIYVSNYFRPLNRNTLWRNVSEKNKTAFVQCAAAPWFGADKQPEISEGPDRGVEGWRGVHEGKEFWGYTSGAAWGDLNGDGTLDLVCANLAHPGRSVWSVSDLSRVYLNTGHSFQDYTLDSGLVYRETNTDPLLADFNNDGHLDLSMTNCYRIWVNQLYEGVGDGSFKEVTFRTGAFACNTSGQAAADFDNDGDLDWFVFDGNQGLLLYENKLIDRGKTPATANWIEIKLHGGKHINSMAYGARVTVQADERIYVREVAGMRGYSSCDDQVVHVGLGGYVGNVNVEVRWMGDRIYEFSGLDVNKRYEIYEADEKESKYKINRELPRDP
jgi:hypothetical protein